jgi:hypothetical protein
MLGTAYGALCPLSRASLHCVEAVDFEWSFRLHEQKSDEVLGADALISLWLSVWPLIVSRLRRADHRRPREKEPEGSRRGRRRGAGGRATQEQLPR